MRNNEPFLAHKDGVSIDETPPLSHDDVHKHSTGSLWERMQQAGAESSTDQAHPNLLLLIIQNLVAIQQKLDELAKQKTSKDWYSTHEVAERLGKAEYTVREWCRHGQCSAEKRKMGRGSKRSWMIPHAELLRLDSEGPRTFR